jgi:hypothetical protein
MLTASNDGVTYSLSENPNDAFAIDAETGEVTVADPNALDFESAQSMQIEVTADLRGRLELRRQSFDIAVTDSNEFDVSAVSDGDAAADADSVARESTPKAGDSVGVSPPSTCDSDATTAPRTACTYSL